VRLAVDANRSWTVTEAITVSRLCEDLAFVLEQPCDCFEETAALRGRVRHPLFLDESIEDLRALVRAITDGLAQGFGLKVTRVGGLSAFRAIRDTCDAYNLPHTCDDAWGGDVIAAACVHVAATVRPRLLEGAWIAAPYIGEHYDPQNPVRIVKGSIEVPSGVGLGVVPATEQWRPPAARYG
jgi:L-alanine-DL-glutamate epimerase-like enolase superfamily enzyme